MELRYYQQEAIDAARQYIVSNPDKHPCIVIPTGGGKTPVIAHLCDSVIKKGGRALVVAHRKELIEQNVDKLKRCTHAPIGVYSAGLNRRDDEHPIIVGGIQSIYRRADQLGPFSVIIIDECHLIPDSGNGMYRKFLQDAAIVNPNVKIVGLTATPYRLDVGKICHPDHFINDICYEISIRRLIDEGFLCQVVMAKTTVDPNLSNVHVRGGEYIQNELSTAMSDDRIVKAAVSELLGLTRDRHSVLCFTCGVAHGEAVLGALRELGQDAEIVTAGTPAIIRHEILGRFSHGALKYLINIEVLTTGFDATCIDAVAMFRPTLSAGLYYQMVGRGFRTDPSKKDCMVLDFASNVMRHGPIDAIDPDRRIKGEGDMVMKRCPQCNNHIPGGNLFCPFCGYVYPPPEREVTHSDRVGDGDILTPEPTIDEYDVDNVRYALHVKRGAVEGDPRTLRVEYETNLLDTYKEWVCLEHPQGSFAKRKADSWWRMRCHLPPPDNIENAMLIAEAGFLAKPVKVRIKTDLSKKYPSWVENAVVGRKPFIDPEKKPRLLSKDEMGSPSAGLLGNEGVEDMMLF